jgi:hypothetical protein
MLLLVASCGRIGFDPTATSDGRNADDAASVPNVMFVSSALQPAATLGGLAGADATCSALAGAAGMTGTFVAWLSTSTGDAWTRLGSARGWVRPDGKPFTDRVADLRAGVVFYPPRLDEKLGDYTGGAPYVVTATGPDGTLVSGSCGDWTNASSGPTYGFPYAGTGGWTGGAGTVTGCDNPTQIYCFQIDHDVAVAPPPPAGRRAFVTAGTFDPSTGVGGADTLCATEATSAGLSGSFRALIATTTATAASRFTLGTPWYRIDGVEVTSDLMTLLAPIDVEANGTYGATTPVTGANDAFSLATMAIDCNDWTSNASTTQAMKGQPGQTPAWFADYPLGCDTTFVTLGVYCFEL